MILNVYKPVGWTSADVVRKVKKFTKEKKVGHGGTLDPFAEGVLIVGTNKDTKNLTSITAMSKTYEGKIQLGVETDTLDVTGTVVNKVPIPQLNKTKINRVFLDFIGDSLQIPPAFSAKKINGVRSYKMARQGKRVTHKPVPIHIFSLNLLTFNRESIHFSVKCSKGTYVRVLAKDIAKKLGTVGHLKTLIRTAIGAYSHRESRHISELEKSWKPISN
jgi:tRNA pseudouridine55 synthase